jgi:hypothetical protein
MILTLDRLGQRYGLLPSEAISRASTFDLVIMDVAMTLEHHAKESQHPNYVPEVDTEELLKIKDRAV